MDDYYVLDCCAEYEGSNFFANILISKFKIPLFIPSSVGHGPMIYVSLILNVDPNLKKLSLHKTKLIRKALESKRKS